MLRLFKVSFIIIFCLVGNLEGSDLHLSADHFSRTVLPDKKALYWIEVLTSEHTSIDSIHVTIEANTLVTIHPSDTLVSSPALFRLSAHANTTVNDTLKITATFENKVERLEVLLHIVDANMVEPKLVLDAPPSGKLEKNNLQSLEGAIVPAKSGHVNIFLQSPQNDVDTLQVEVNSEGLFYINHIFKSHGKWNAWAIWQEQNNTGSPNPTSSDKIEFEVKPRPVRLTVSAKEFHEFQSIQDSLLQVPDSLQVVGQIASDFISNTTINIEISDPDKESIAVRNFKLDTTSGNFSANFPTGKKAGVYRIKADAYYNNSFGDIEETCKNLYYASIGSHSHLIYPMFDNSGGITTSISEGSVPAPYGYAVIVVGHNINYIAHLNIASRLREELIYHRGLRPNDIMFETLHEDPNNNLTPKGKKFSDLKTQIEGSLKAKIANPHFNDHKGLLFFWIGNANNSGTRFDAGPSLNVHASDIAAVYKDALNQNDGAGNELWSRFNGIIFMHGGDNSGLLLENILSTGFPPSGITTEYYSLSSIGSGVEDYSLLCGLTTFASYFLQATVANRHVLSAFKYGWQKISHASKIDCDRNISNGFESNVTIETFGTAACTFNDFQLGYDINHGKHPPQAQIVTTSIANSPQLSSEGTVYIAFDNPNKYPIHQVRLMVEAYDTSKGQFHCLRPLQPIDSTSLWQAELDLYVKKGWYRGIVIAQYQDENGHCEQIIDSFERYRHDTTTVIQDTIPVQKDPNSICKNPLLPYLELNFEMGITNVNYKWREKTYYVPFIGLNFFSECSGYVEYVGLGVSTNYDKSWVLIIPLSLNLGKLPRALTKLNFIPDLWAYWGIGYEWNDIARATKTRVSMKAARQFVGLKIRLSF